MAVGCVLLYLCELEPLCYIYEPTGIIRVSESFADQVTSETAPFVIDYVKRLV